MNKLSAPLLSISFCLLVGGAAVLSVAAGLLTAGVLTGAVGVLSMTASPKTSSEKEPQ